MTGFSTCAASNNGTGLPPVGVCPELIDDADTEQVLPRQAKAFSDCLEHDADRPLGQKASVILIDDRILARECLHSNLAAHGVPWNVVEYNSVEEWHVQAGQHPPAAAVLLHVDSDNISESHVEERIKRVVGASGSAPLIILADQNDMVQILKALEYGARGYIPSSVSVEVCVQAINLALAGGVFVPASTVFAMRMEMNSAGSQDRRLAGIFTSRQLQVAKLIREGKPNKIIAYELNLRESTVKVHIRTIMQKLKATNRTETAYKVSNLFASNGMGL